MYPSWDHKLKNQTIEHNTCNFIYFVFRYFYLKANVTNSERKLPNTGINSVATASLGVVVLLAALALRKRKNR